MVQLLLINKQRLTSLLTTIGFLIFLSPTSFSQWELSFPTEAQNGHFFIKAPQNTNKFYLFGHDVKALDATNQSLVDLAAFPADVLYKESTTGYSAPYRHMDIFTWDEQKWWMIHKGRIFKTTNAGNDWQEVLALSPNTPYISSSYFTSIHFPSENVGYAVGTADKIFRTLNGGNTWEALQWSTSTAPYRRLSKVHFVTESVGFALGYEVDDILLNIGVFKPFYYYTTDAGQTWSETSFPESDHHYVDLQVVWGDTWYLSLTNRNFIAPNDKLYKSTDGGNNWEAITLPGTSSIATVVLRGMHWFTPEEGIILGSTEFFGAPNHIYKTYDGGQTWQQIILDAGIAPFFSKIPNIVMQFNGDHGVIAGASGNLLYSDDKGETWQNLRKGLPDVYDLSSDGDHTYAALYGNTLLKHNASGWTELNVPVNNQYPRAAFIKVSNLGTDQVATVDVYGELHYSQDGGNTWHSFFSSLDTTVLDLQFTDGKLAALMYTNNQLLYFPDVADQQHSEQITATATKPASVFELFYIGDQIFAKVEALLFRRIGGNWETITINDAFIRSIFMDHTGNALIRSHSNAYLYSNDTAQTWQPATFSNAILNQVNFEISKIEGFGRLNDSTHYALIHGSPELSRRFESSLILSSDQGKTWELADFTSFSEPNDLGRIAHAVDNKGNLWIGTANGAIYQWLLDETVTGREDPINQLFSIYPNPTTGRFKIDTPLPIKAYQLFNLQGKLIENGYFDQNTELEIPAQQPAGLYLLQLVMDNGNQTAIKVLKE
ncbi:MAG: YCF48-related protein [Flammeovirgaceae bacterium]